MCRARSPKWEVGDSVLSVPATPRPCCDLGGTRGVPVEEPARLGEAVLDFPGAAVIQEVHSPSVTGNSAVFPAGIPCWDSRLNNSAVISGLVKK